MVERIDSTIARLLPFFDALEPRAVNRALIARYVEQRKGTAAREAAGHTQLEAGGTVHSGERSWQDWERGERRMHLAFFELYLRKTGQIAN